MRGTLSGPTNLIVLRPVSSILLTSRAAEASPVPRSTERGSVPGGSPRSLEFALESSSLLHSFFGSRGWPSGSLPHSSSHAGAQSQMLSEGFAPAWVLTSHQDPLSPGLDRQANVLHTRDRSNGSGRVVEFTRRAVST